MGVKFNYLLLNSYSGLEVIGQLIHTLKIQVYFPCPAIPSELEGRLLPGEAHCLLSI